MGSTSGAALFEMLCVHAVLEPALAQIAVGGFNRFAPHVRERLGAVEAGMAVKIHAPANPWLVPVAGRDEWIFERCRLVRQHVEPDGGKLTRLEVFEQCTGIADRPARRIDEI